MHIIKNPVLPGFNPDPAILRVGDDYYVATSTFEWFPGVQIHHSRDLVNWRLLTRPLTRTSQLNLLGDPDSGGTWAPRLSHDGEKFWLVYTDVKNMPWHITPDLHNYVVTAPDITGPSWSDRFPPTAAALTLPCFTTTMARNGSSTCAGITVRGGTTSTGFCFRNLTRRPACSPARPG